MSEHFVTYNQVVKHTVKKTVLLELNHCPFCGGEAEFRRTNEYSSNGGGHGVRCKDCKTIGPLRMGDGAQLKVAEHWNKRAKS